MSSSSSKSNIYVPSMTHALANANFIFTTIFVFARKTNYVGPSVCTTRPLETRCISSVLHPHIQVFDNMYMLLNWPTMPWRAAWKHGIGQRGKSAETVTVTSEHIISQVTSTSHMNNDSKHAKLSNQREALKNACARFLGKNRQEHFRCVMKTLHLLRIHWDMIVITCHSLKLNLPLYSHRFKTVIHMPSNRHVSWTHWTLTAGINATQPKGSLHKKCMRKVPDQDKSNSKAYRLASHSKTNRQAGLRLIWMK